MLKALLALAAATVLAVSPAAALDYPTAESVVSIMEELTEETGLRMSADSAANFFEYDAFSGERIPAAGFTEESWTEAYSAVAGAYMASIPSAEFEALLAAPLAQLDAAELPEEHKQQMRDHLQGLFDAATDQRERGMADAVVVQPLVPRLKVLFFGD
jgi:hypothetical protein